MPTDRLFRCVELASRIHRDQLRYDLAKTPYAAHLFGVALLLSTVTNDEDVIIAGLMHDSLEDVPDYTYEKLEIDCGKRVADIVREVTEDKSKPYLERKREYIDNVRNGSHEALLVALADKIHNASCHIDIDPLHNISREFQTSMYTEVLSIGESRITSAVEFSLIARLRSVLVS
jgi:(p)ppGpp synthase/HD superfamily hydrolase